MINTLYPRLSSHDALAYIEKIKTISPESLAIDTPVPRQGVGETYAEIGGTRIRSSDLESLQSNLRNIANQFGFPKSLSLDARHQFDQAIGIHLFENMRISAHEASQPAVWQYLCAMVLPDLVRWRFPRNEIDGSSSERFIGGRRNAFGRLWWRAYVLKTDSSVGNDPYELMKSLGEDESVQLMERPAVFGDRRLVKAVANAFLLESKRSNSTRQKLMREIQKRLVRRMPLVFFGAMNDEMLANEMQQLAKLTSESLADAQNVVV